MFEQEKEKMVQISQYAGRRVDYVQGGGGNTSYKFDDKLMAIKASGFALNEVETEKGYVTVNYAGLKADYAKLAQAFVDDIEKATLEINLNRISLLEGMDKLRPSVEVGFHSYLPRAVVHTHSVYANILCCSEEGESLAQDIFGLSELGYIYIPFINPGFTLSKVIKEKSDRFETENGKKPDLIFMENHGIIASNNDAERAIEIHEKANQMIIDHLKLNAFPQSVVEKTSDGYVSKTEFIQRFVFENNLSVKYFDTIILYPDQIVYLGSNLSNSISINSTTSEFQYLMEEKQAKVVDEVVLGIVYIISEIKRCGLTLQLLSDEGVSFIRSWESEKYRASLVK